MKQNKKFNSKILLTATLVAAFIVVSGLSTVNALTTDGAITTTDDFYQVSDYPSVDGLAGTNTSDIAADKDKNTYIGTDGVVRVYAPSGSLIRQIGDGVSGCHVEDDPCIGYGPLTVVDSQGITYIMSSLSDPVSRRTIKKFSADGTFLGALPQPGSGSMAATLFIDNSDNLYYLYTTELYKLAPGSTNPTRIDIDGGIYTLEKVVVSKNGDIYCAGMYRPEYTYSVLHYSSSGTYVNNFFDTGNSDIINKIALDDSGNMYLSMRSSVRKINSSGTEVDSYPFTSDYQNVGLDPYGSLYSTNGGGFTKLAKQKQYKKTYKTGKQNALSIPAVANFSTVKTYDEADNTSQDSSHDYLQGMIDFAIDVPSGSTQSIDAIFETDLPLSQIKARKYNATTKTYSDISGASVTETTLDGKRAVMVSYVATDGGLNDDDGTANGVIVDPVGIGTAVSAASSAPSSIPSSSASPAMPAAAKAPNTGLRYQGQNLAIFGTLAIVCLGIMAFLARRFGFKRFK